MAIVTYAEVSWTRMSNAIERVRQRLLRAAHALEEAGVPYAVAGGNAVAAWVSRVDEAAARNTQDVDVLIRRADLDRATAALAQAGFVYRHVAGIDVFLDGPLAKARDAVHVVFAGEKVRPRRCASPDNSRPFGDGVDLTRIEKAVRDILLAVGEDPDREGLRETPGRVARMYAEMFAGLRKDPREPLKKTFTQKYDEMVLVRDIGFESLCEHHLLPFIGKAHIAYLPNGKIVGLSKLARVVEIFARRPQVQERMTEDIADLVMAELDAKGVGVVIEASHMCMVV